MKPFSVDLIVQALRRNYWLLCMGPVDDRGFIKVDLNKVYRTPSKLLKRSYVNACRDFSETSSNPVEFVQLSDTEFEVSAYQLAMFALNTSRSLLREEMFWRISEWSFRSLWLLERLTIDLEWQIYDGHHPTTQSHLSEIEHALSDSIRVSQYNVPYEALLAALPEPIEKFKGRFRNQIPRFSSLYLLARERELLLTRAARNEVTLDEVVYFNRTVGFLASDVKGDKWWDAEHVASACGIHGFSRRFLHQHAPTVPSYVPPAASIEEPVALSLERLSILGDLLALHEELRHYWQARVIYDLTLVEELTGSQDSALRNYGTKESVAVFQYRPTKNAVFGDRTAAEPTRVCGVLGDGMMVVSGNASILLTAGNSCDDLRAAIKSEAIIATGGGDFSHLRILARELNVPYVAVRGESPYIALGELVEIRNGEVYPGAMGISNCETSSRSAR